MCCMHTFSVCMLIRFAIRNINLSTLLQICNKKWPELPIRHPDHPLQWVSTLKILCRSVFEVKGKGKTDPGSRGNSFVAGRSKRQGVDMGFGRLSKSWARRIHDFVI